MKEELSNEVENIVAKGEIARYEQFLFLPKCFQELSSVDASQYVDMWEMDQFGFQVALFKCNNK